MPGEVIMTTTLHPSDGDYMEYARQASMVSTCKKKQLGCALVFTRGRKGCITGSNGPPSPLRRCDPCPRLDSHGGTDLGKCRAVHAERAVLLLAGKYGFCTYESILYSYMGVPCKDCLLEISSAGVSEIVCIRETYYDALSRDILKELIDEGSIRFRIYNPRGNDL
jgi:deoxycytidylate deaminase